MGKLLRFIFHSFPFPFYIFIFEFFWDLEFYIDHSRVKKMFYALVITFNSPKSEIIRQIVGVCWNRDLANWSRLAVLWARTTCKIISLQSWHRVLSGPWFESAIGEIAPDTPVGVAGLRQTDLDLFDRVCSRLDNRVWENLWK